MAGSVGPHASIDTGLDALSAQARAHPPLQPEVASRLLREARAARGGPASATLVEHHLTIALDAALARPRASLPVTDLYQEGAIAVVVAVDEYVGREGGAADLAGYVRRVVSLHLDAALEREDAVVAASETMVRDAELLSAAEVRLRRELGRDATPIELAALLTWTAARVHAVSDALHTAAADYDADLVQYLDDDDADDRGDTEVGDRQARGSGN